MNSRRTRLGSAFGVILTVLVLVPTGVFFARVWQDNSDRHDSTQLERQGVEYLGALNPLLSSLAEYESSALQGVPEQPDTLKPAIARVSEVDSKLGDSLNTKDRWAGLQDKINKLAKPADGGQLAVYQQHTEVSDLMLALYGTIRRNAHLNRDPDNDVSNLQEASVIDMPTTIVLVSRMGDLANILQNTSGATRANVGVQFGEGVLAVQAQVNSLTDNLQAAVDDTKSPTLSGNLVSTLDAFRRGVESMLRGANPGGNPNVATMSTAQSSLQTALNSLSGVTLREMDGLLSDRASNITYRRTEAIVLGLVAIGLVLTALIWPAIGRRREPAPVTPPRPTGEPSRDVAMTMPTGGPVYGNNPYDQGPQYGGPVDPTQRERSGAIR
jgi:hypothetical protein